MDIIIEELIVELGDIVTINDAFYIVVELPSCVNYEIGDVIQPGFRFYLHGYDGKSFYNYPTTLDDLAIQIREDKGTIYKKCHYNMRLTHKESH